MRLIPRDEKFFELFAELGSRLSRSASLLAELFAEPNRTPEIVAAIKAVEHEADDLMRNVADRINRSFVTPIDREDVALLASALDNVIDLMDGTARRMEMFHIREVREPAKLLARILLKTAVEIEAAVSSMMKPKLLSSHTAEIKRLEEEADTIYHRAVGDLFAGDPDPLEVIKWKEIYDTLERAIDQCEDVGNVVQSVSLKNS